MKVKIIKPSNCDYVWYNGLIGQKFNVEEYKSDIFKLKEHELFIPKKDCEIVEEEVNLKSQVSEEWAREFLRDSNIDQVDYLYMNDKIENLKKQNRIKKSKLDEAREFYDQHIFKKSIEVELLKNKYEEAIKELQENKGE